MALTFFTDPHLGLKRTAHTTSRSQALLRERLFREAYAIPNSTYGDVFCLGDLFDTTENDEDTFLQGYELVLGCTGVLAGNHDISNRVDVKSSLQKLRSIQAVYNRIIVSNDPGKPNVQYSQHMFESQKNVLIAAVPHCLTQEIFEESVRNACNVTVNEEVCRVLLLHCNVGDGHGEYHKDSSTLCLTTPLQKHVIEHFDYVLVGHEHVPRELYDGKLVILGNTFPVSFGEIADRFVYRLEDGVLTKTRSVEAAKIYRRLTCQELLAEKGKIDVTQDFIEIDGQLPFSEVGEFSRAIERFWKANPHLLMVKNSVAIDTPERAAPVKFFADLAANVQRDAKTNGFEAELSEILTGGADL